MSGWAGSQITLADGKSLSVLTMGPADGPRTLLLHGFPDSPHTYDELGPIFAAAGRRCVAPYLPGYGESAPPTPGRHDDGHLARPVLGLADALGWETFDAFGHDWGAIACYTAASRSPERIRRLVCVAVPPLRTFFWSLSVRQAIRSRYTAWFQLVGLGELDFRADELRGLDELWRRWSPDWDYTEAQRAPAVAALAESRNAFAALRYYRRTFRAVVLDGDQREAANTPVSVPTLLVYGRNDGCLGPEIMERARRDFSGESEFLPVANGGHFAHREASNLVATRALEWWARA